MSRPLYPRIPLASIAVAAGLAACGGNDADEGPYLGLGKPAAFVATAQPLPPNASEYDRQMQFANLNVGAETDIMKPKFCFEPGTGTDAALQDASVVPPTQLFDDLYYVGQVRVGTYALKTDDGGFILFDTMDNANLVQTILLPGLQQLGLNPATMRSIQITHGHGDHDGGAPFLQSTYAPPSLFASSADYTTSKTYRASTVVDSSITTPQQFNIAGKAVTILSTPGHTTGTMSYIVPVKHKGVDYKLAYLGGSAFPGTAALASQYLRSTERMYDLIKQTDAVGSINSHTFFDKSDARIQRARTQGLANSNPMIQGNDQVLRSFSVLRQCSAALLSQRDATTKNAVWRITKTELYGASLVSNSGVINAAARVSNPFAVIANAPVTFTASSGGACTANTDTDGIATCRISTPVGTAAATVRATFAGVTTIDAADLTSSASVSVAR